MFKDKETQIHTCQGQGYSTLQNWIFDTWLKPYLENKTRWMNDLESILVELAQRLQINQWVEKHLTGIEELILIPHLYLHQIPFAALPLEEPHPPAPSPDGGEGGKREESETWFLATRLEKYTNSAPTNVSKSPTHSYLGDRFRLRYIPSCQILEFCEQRSPIEAVNYGIAENATEDLPCTIFEADKIAQLYNIPDGLRLRGRRQAQVQSYRNLAKKVQVLHSSHHAQCCIYNPLESQLILGDGRITLGELLSPGWRLPNLSDVFLSCCETNLGVTKTTDDILTLGTGFLCAGARSVVSTQWAVNDLATALFSIFYYSYRQLGETRPEALRKAQVKLRTLTGETLKLQYRDELDFYLKQQLDQANAARKQAKAQQDKEEYELWSKVGDRAFNAREELKKLCGLKLPFASSYYWAGFICQGMR